MWKLFLFLLYATGVFAVVSVDFGIPLDSCLLTVQSTIGKVASDPRDIVTYGILNRFAISDPPVNHLTIAGGGTSGVFDDLGDGLYCVGFSVKSDYYSMSQLRNIVVQQWNNTNLFTWNLKNAGNWKIVSVHC